MAVVKTQENERCYIPSEGVIPFSTWKGITQRTRVDIYASGQYPTKVAIQIASFYVYYRTIEEFNKQMDEYMSSSGMMDNVFFTTNSFVF